MTATRRVESRSASEPSPWRSRLLASVGLALFGGMGVIVWLFGYWEPRVLPILVIEVEGGLHHHSSELLQQTLSERLHGGILTADLDDLKSAAEELPWVGHANLRRVWPDRLLVRVEEHRPIARWNADGLVTAEGIVFHPLSRTIPAGLPLLEGDDKRAPEVAKRYQQWRDELMLAGHLIQSLSVDPRGDWRVVLVMGTELRLGTGPVEERLARFIASAPQLEAAGRPLVVDLRYSNGFAVKWASDAGPQVRANSGRSKRSGNRG
ncbi:cell division protein FtsQ [Thiorhodococcus drewsii AZ1]|uniref:Cell division protein FtsQ n=1 Tax=Thiorhodococcus drewsii AZ1 TaxID=765913 RepID=G2E019_9GAMM|nr:cell division protein FtsQ/DivIB [Thiorhodococcus drewsii]EGV32058.1 cell division protein FtsQ [Thiorhodococcus drewsii AZ1]